MATETPDSDNGTVYLPPRPAAPEPAAAAEPATEVSPRSPLLGRLLNMAHGYRRALAFHNALEIYFKLVEQFPDTPEAEEARAALIDIGEWYERGGEPRQARSIFERLL